MVRRLLLTEDGSHTLFVNEMDEPYHSIHSAIQESMHVFINQGFRRINKTQFNILELGFGTGLNVMLTLAEAKSVGTKIYYHTVEKYPLDPNEYIQLNYEQIIEDIPPGILVRMHEAPWDMNFEISDAFTIHKEKADFRTMEPEGKFDLVYFDAFSPDKQPHLWTKEIFCKLSELLHPGGILVSYTAKGSVRRALSSCKFNVERVPGPPGKREMIRATKR